MSLSEHQLFESYEPSAADVSCDSTPEPAVCRLDCNIDQTSSMFMGLNVNIFDDCAIFLKNLYRNYLFDIVHRVRGADAACDLTR